MTTFDPNLILLYVDNVEQSEHFYAELLNAKPIHKEPFFVLFLLKPGLRLGLWSSSNVEPKPTSLGVTSELALLVADDQSIDSLFVEYENKGFTFCQTPTHMDFGYTFVVSDPDGHRIRFFSKHEA